MQEILKRLEIIKNSIEIADEESISFQVTKLITMDTEHSIDIILELLQDKHYTKAFQEINKYIVANKIEEIQGSSQAIKLENKELTKILRLKSEKLETYEKKIIMFNELYISKLGPKIIEVLHSKMDTLYSETKALQDDLKKRQEHYTLIDNSINDKSNRLDEILEELEKVDTYDEVYPELKSNLNTLKEEIQDNEDELYYRLNLLNDTKILINENENKFNELKSKLLVLSKISVDIKVNNFKSISTLIEEDGYSRDTSYRIENFEEKNLFLNSELKEITTQINDIENNSTFKNIINIEDINIFIENL